MDAVAGPTYKTDDEKFKAKIARLRRLLREAEAEIARLAPLVDLDPLVSLFNSRAFARELARVVSYCQRYSTSATLLYVDLDEFKSVNDRFGHAAGDAVLKHVAHLLIQHTRRSDILGRLGGDEFGVVLVRTDIAAGQLVAERIRAAIAQAAIRFGGTEVSISASIGVALADGSTEPDRVIRLADEAMYKMRWRGRSPD